MTMRTLVSFAKYSITAGVALILFTGLYASAWTGPTVVPTGGGSFLNG
jgi:hypothetical protein